MNIEQITYETCVDSQKEITQYIFESVKRSAYEESYTYEDAKKKFEKMRVYLSREQAIVYGAMEDGTCIGFIWAYQYPFRDEKERIYVSILYIEESCRNRGIGALLLAHVEKKAVENGCKAVYLHTEACNDAALRFYEREGFEKERIQLARHVAEEERLVKFSRGGD